MALCLAPVALKDDTIGQERWWNPRFGLRRR